MEFPYEPVENYCDPNDLKPLELDDDEGEDENPYDYFDNTYAENGYEDYEYEKPELGGFDDLRPFGSFSDGYGWDDGFL